MNKQPLSITESLVILGVCYITINFISAAVQYAY